MREAATPPGSAELLALLERRGVFRLEVEADCQAFVAQSGQRLLLLTDEPSRVPEAWDLAVVLPELLKVQPGLAAAALPPALARLIGERLGVKRWPALVAFRDGRPIGAIEGMRDWGEYRRELPELLQRTGGWPAGARLAVLDRDGPDTC